MNLPLKDNEVSAVAQAEELTLIHVALVGLRKGDPKVKLPYRGSPGFGKVAEVFNDLVEQNVAVSLKLAALNYTHLLVRRGTPGGVPPTPRGPPPTAPLTCRSAATSSSSWSGRSRTSS